MHVAAADLHIGAKLQVLAHSHGREELAALGHQRATQQGDGFGGMTANLLLVKQDLASLGTQQAGNGMQQGGLARAVGTDDGHDLARRNVDRHPA